MSAPITVTATSVTDEQIRALRTGYVADGNSTMVDICDEALAPTATWHAYARGRCAAAITEMFAPITARMAAGAIMREAAAARARGDR